MKLVCISDTHNLHGKLSGSGPLPEGDVLIHAGDATGIGEFKEIAAFLSWLDAQPHRHKLLIAGNHDWGFQRDPDITAMLLKDHPGITYLQDSGCEIEGVTFWGSPWQPWFMSWAFNLPRKGEALRDRWNLIPMGTDVVITHGPPFGILDQVGQGEHLGCEELAIRLAAVKPGVHVFGHIHDGYGQLERDGTRFINACSCDEGYRAVNPPIVIEVRP